MSTINDSISRVRSGLLNPKAQSPTVDQLFTNLTYEYQNFYNEIDSTNKPWTYHDITVNVSASTTDYLVPITPGKILFVIAYPTDTNYGAVSLEFADLADVSSDFFLYSPLDFGFSPDFNELVNFPFPLQIAFYRKDNNVWFRLAPFAYALTSIKIIYSTGDWLQNLTTESTAVLSNHHQLVEVRTMMNSLPAADWVSDEKTNQNRRNNLAMSLATQEARYAKQFMYAKRMMTADETNVRMSYNDDMLAML